ncbi:zinc transport system permease protein [Brevinema andersonii]|uniref:Zinc transport system permease protein n=1 Tax=Brevinema andersonii TaxID=34097 RepID=A0A1I1DFV0_BREAD|nr:metal ABC transporter permease [Brevinema andersonii]SFB71938.1 zinc transport system permease protein [Brevinema andersonii]
MLWQFSFFRYAVGISFVLSILFALISFIIVVRKLSFLAVGTEHAAFGGVGLAKFLGWNVFPVTLGFSMLLTVLAGLSSKKSHLTPETNTSLLFSAAMAFGTMLFSLNRGSGFNLMGFLFGDIIGITHTDLITAVILTSIVIFIIVPAFGKIIYLSFDRQGAIVAGANSDLWDTLVYAALSASIVLGIKLVGVLLVAAMTVLPAAFALLWKKNTIRTLMIAFCFTLFSMLTGVLLSFVWDIAPGSLIVAVAVVIYFAACQLVRQ